MTEGNLNQKLCTIIIAMCMVICGMASDHKEVVTTTKFDAQSIIEIHRIQQAVQETQAEFSMDGKTNHTKFSNISIKTSKRDVRINALVKLNSDIGTSVLYDKGFNVTPLCNNFSIYYFIYWISSISYI